MRQKSKVHNYFSNRKFFYFLKEMNKYPLSYILYAIPSIILILLITTLINFTNFINSDFMDSTSTQNLLSDFNSYILLIGVYIVLYYLSDSMVAHFSFTQFNNKSTITQTLLKSYKTYPKFLVHKILQLLFMFLPIIVGSVLIALLSSLFNSLFVIENTSMFIILLFLLLIIGIFIGSVAFSLYNLFKYSYLPVSIHFMKKNKFIQLKQYHKSIKGHLKSIIIRIIILILIVSLFNLIQLIYDQIVTVITISTLTLILQIIGVLLTMFISYFTNTYLFFTYKEEFEK